MVVIYIYLFQQGYDTGYGSDGSYSDEGDENKGGEYVSQPTDDGYGNYIQLAKLN